VIAADDTNCETQHKSALAVQVTQNCTEFPALDGNLESNEEILPKKDGGTYDKTQKRRPRGRPRKNATVIAVDDTNCDTQYKSAPAIKVTQSSTEFPALDGNLENNEEILPITYKRKRGAQNNKDTTEKSSVTKRHKGKPKTNLKEVTSDPNCENQYVPLDVQVPEDSAEFLSPDLAHENCNESTLQQHSVTQQKHAKKAAVCNTFSTSLVKSSTSKSNHGEERHSQDISQPLLIQCDNEANHQPCSSELEHPAATCSIPGDVSLPRVVSCLAHNGKVAWDVKPP